VSLSSINIMSPYPYICKIPIGHPIIHVGDACADKEACLKMNGLMKCTIVPLKNLYHPFETSSFYSACADRVFKNLTRLANVSIYAMLKGVWKARGWLTKCDWQLTEDTKFSKFKKFISTKSRNTIPTRVKAEIRGLYKYVSET